ncbi:MAG: hypothetical protein ABEJ36_05365 [Candidatus Nanosalina sp.]
MEECDYCGKEFEEEKTRIQHELKEHEDEISGHDREDKKARLNKLKEREKASRRERKQKMIYAGIATISIAVLALGGFQAYQFTQTLGPEKIPGKGIGVPVHWHADYTISICGKNRVLRGGPAIAHTHGQKRFHLEGVRSREEATLDGILDNLGARFKPENNSILGKDSCNGEPANLTVNVNGQPIENPAEYIVRDGDSIRVTLSG